MLLESWGYQYDVASNGLEAVELAKCNQGKYDICFMDTNMPVMNGFEATRIMRERLRYFPILSTSVDWTYEDKLLELGADDFIAKPYDPEVLQKKIIKLTTKTIKIYVDTNNVTFRKELPMDSKQLKELIELDKKGLALLIIEGGQQKFVVHKNIQNKMSHVLIGEGKELFEFLDRGDNPANCHLYRSNLQTNRLLLTPQEFERRLREEDGDIDEYSKPIDENFSKEGKNE